MLWTNLLKHYVLSLMQEFVEHLLVSEAPVQDIQIRIGIAPADSRTDAASLAIDTFFSSLCVKEVLQQLSALSIPLRREGLHSYLVVLHAIAWQAVHNALEVNGMCTASSVGTRINEAELLAAIQDTGFANTQLSANPVHLDLAFGASSRIHQQLGLIFNYNKRNSGHPKKTYLLSNFPELYVDGLIANLVHPPWFVASFSRTCTNASMWGTYAASHTGAALQFSLNGADGEAPLALGNTVDTDAAYIAPVDYSIRAPTVEFFRSLGNLADREVLTEWLCDAQGNMSPTIREIITVSDRQKPRGCDRDERGGRFLVRLG